MTRHPRRTVPATIVAVVLLAVCAAVATAVIQSLIGRTPFITLDRLLAVTSSQQWNSAPVVTTAIVVAVVGLVLLLVAIRPGRPIVLPLARQEGADGNPGADAGVRRATLTKDLSAAASTVSGVESVSVDARPRRVIAQVQTAGTAEDVPGAVRERLTERLADIAPARMPAVRVKVRRDGGA